MFPLSTPVSVTFHTALQDVMHTARLASGECEASDGALMLLHCERSRRLSAFRWACDSLARFIQQHQTRFLVLRWLDNGAHAQAALCEEIAVELGFDLDCGRLDVSVHPFTGGAMGDFVTAGTCLLTCWDLRQGYLSMESPDRRPADNSSSASSAAA